MMKHTGGSRKVFWMLMVLCCCVAPVAASAPKLLSDQSGQVGQFAREGEYMKDYFVLKKGHVFHLFYNVGRASQTQDWQEADNEKAFGHATSTDLVHWQSHPRVMQVVPGTWEGMVVSAPSIVKYGGTYYMVYTGFDDRWLGKQTVGVATSRDLYHWKRVKTNPVYTAPQWARLNPNGWEDCRDAHILRYKGEFLLFSMVTTQEGKGAIALATSRDALHWTDRGPALITFTTPESPRVFEHKGTYYMFASSGHGRVLCKSSDPLSNRWEEVPFDWPPDGLWSGWEVVEDRGQLIFSAFKWQLGGNFIRFWEVEWKGDIPVIRY